MTHFLFIDASVEDIDTLQAHVNPGTIVHRIKKNVDGIEYITQTLKAKRHRPKTAKSSISDLTISIVAHGVPGALHLGNTILNLASLKRYRDRLQQWFSGTPLKLGHHDRLQLYSCDVAANTEGQELIYNLRRLTYATVYASTTKMGNPKRGGNWNFDTLLSWNARFVPLLGYSQPPAPRSPFDSGTRVAYSGIFEDSATTTVNKKG